jgi:hypothetical protein
MHVIYSTYADKTYPQAHVPDLLLNFLLRLHVRPRLLLCRRLLLLASIAIAVAIGAGALELLSVGHLAHKGSRVGRGE